MVPKRLTAIFSNCELIISDNVFIKVTRVWLDLFHNLDIQWYHYVALFSTVCVKPGVWLEVGQDPWLLNSGEDFYFVFKRLPVQFVPKHQSCQKILKLGFVFLEAGFWFKEHHLSLWPFRLRAKIWRWILKLCKISPRSDHGLAGHISRFCKGPK